MDNQAPQPAPHAPQTNATPLNDATATNANSDAGDATSAKNTSTPAPHAPQAAVADGIHFTLTVEDARALFAKHNRKVPAERTLQDYCLQGKIAGTKSSTPEGAAWYINEASVLKFIQSRPAITTAEASHAPQTDAAPLNDTPANSDAGGAEPAAPQTVGKSHTSLTEDIFEHPYVKRLEGEVVEYKNLYREQVTRTEEIQRESADKILALTQQVLIAGSKNLGDYLLESFGMKRQNMAPDAQERVEPSSS